MYQCFSHFSVFCIILTLPMLRLLSSKAQGRKDFWKPLKPCHVGIHWIALAEYSQMSTHLPGFIDFSGFLHYFVLAILDTSSIRVNPYTTAVPSKAWLCWGHILCQQGTYLGISWTPKTSKVNKIISGIVLQKVIFKHIIEFISPQYKCHDQNCMLILCLISICKYIFIVGWISSE